MLKRAQAAIIKKDFRSIILNKRLFPVLIIVPLVLALIVPSIFIITIHFIPADSPEIQELLVMVQMDSFSGDLKLIAYELVLNRIMPLFFMMIPLMAATVMAASSFVGEKEKRTLETLLYSPITLKGIFQAKILASFLMSMLVSYGAFLMMTILVEIEFLITTGGPIWPSISWLIVMLMLSPAISMVAIILIVRGSAKAQTVEEAQQRAMFLIFPLLLLIIVQFSGIIQISNWLLLIISILLFLLAGFLLKNVINRKDYESMLS